MQVISDEVRLWTDCSPVEQVARACGGYAAAGRMLGVSTQSVWRWAHGFRVPAERVLELERISCGLVTRGELRPDLFGGEAD